MSDAGTLAGASCHFSTPLLLASMMLANAPESLNIFSSPSSAFWFSKSTALDFVLSSLTVAVLLALTTASLVTGLPACFGEDCFEPYYTNLAPSYFFLSIIFIALATLACFKEVAVLVSFWMVSDFF